MPDTTRLEDIFLCLKSADIPVYFPGQHVGMCTENYVVVKPGVVMPYMQLSTNICYYELLCYTPEQYPTQTERFKEEVKTAMLNIHPTVRYKNSETPPYFDDDVKGWMVDLTYASYKKFDSAVYQKSKGVD